MEIARPPEIEPPSNLLLIHRLSRAMLPPAVRAGLHPNLITALGLILGLLAGLSYTGWTDWRFATLGFVLMIGWLVMDGLDGQLARATGKTSDAGRLMDGVADYSTFVAVYLALALTHDEPGKAALIGVVSGVAHALQSQFYEGERATYIRRLAGRFTAVQRPQTGGLIERLHNRGEAMLGNRVRPFDDELARATPERRAAMLSEWRRHAAPTIRWMAPLSSNGRTFAIWVAALAQEPLYYWAWEICGLTLISLAAARRLRHSENRST